jgi:hypothetical protein
MGLVRPSRGSWLTTPSSPLSGVGEPSSFWQHQAQVGGAGGDVHVRQQGVSQVHQLVLDVLPLQKFAHCR